MSIVKYVNKQNAPDQNYRTHWGRAPVDGLPLRFPDGQAFRLREKEFGDNARASEDYHVQIFDLMNPTDLAAYQEVLDRIVNGVCKFYRRENLPETPKSQTYRVLLEWSDIYLELPDTLVRDSQ